MEDLIGKIIIDQFTGKDNEEFFVTEDSVLILEGSVNYDRCGDVDDVSIYEVSNTGLKWINDEDLLRAGLITQEEVDRKKKEKEEAKRKKEAEEAFRKEQLRKKKEEEEIKKMEEYAEKFGYVIKK